MHLPDLLSPISVESWRETFVDKKVLVLNRNDPDYYSKVINLTQFKNLLLVSAMRASECRVVKADEQISPYKYTLGPKQPDFCTADYDRYVDIPKVFGLYSQGCSVSLIGLDRYHPTLGTLKNSLMAELGAHVHINLYASPKDSTGLPIHRDEHDVFILQLDGEKEWGIFDSETDLPLSEAYLSKSRELDGQLQKSFVLRKGDFAFIPRGFAHQAKAINGPSIHLTIGIRWITKYDIYSQFLKVFASQERQFRETFSDFRDGSNSESLLLDLKRLLESPNAIPSIEKALSEIEQRWSADVTPISAHVFYTMDLLASQISSTTTLKLAYPEFTKLEIDNDETFLSYPGNRISVHKAMVSLVISILKTGCSPFSIDQVVIKSPDESYINFIKFLIKDGFLIAVDPELK